MHRRPTFLRCLYFLYTLQWWHCVLIESSQSVFVGWVGYHMARKKEMGTRACKAERYVCKFNFALHTVNKQVVVVVARFSLCVHYLTRSFALAKTAFCWVQYTPQYQTSANAFLHIYNSRGGGGRHPRQQFTDPSIHPTIHSVSRASSVPPTLWEFIIPTGLDWTMESTIQKPMRAAININELL